MGEIIRVLSSNRMIEILEKLSGGTKTKKELKDNIEISSSSLAQILHKMFSLNLIKEEGDNISILPKGEYMLKICHTISAHEDFLDKFGEYVNMYILEDIPEYLVARFYELREISVVERCADVYLPHEEFVENLANSRTIYGYTSVFFPQYIKLFSKFAEEGKNIEIMSKVRFDTWNSYTSENRKDAENDYNFRYTYTGEGLNESP
jgi:predicted transcriptional regulator